MRFFVLDSNYWIRSSSPWLEDGAEEASDDWKICYFHHPLYSDGGRHGSDVDLRVALEPLFVKYGVNVVFSGHDHIYERFKPQTGHLLLRLRVERPAAERRRASLGADRGVLRPGPGVLARRDQRGRAVFPGALQDRTTVDAGTIRRQTRSQAVAN